MNSYYEGFKRSKGKYIFFLDSDDYFKINKVTKVIKAFDKHFSNVIFDLPIIKTKNKLEYKRFKQKIHIFQHTKIYTSKLHCC